jgi:hypothetical protein
MSMEDREMVENMITDHGIDTEPLVQYTAPPGEEGLDFSHAGGEYEAFEGLAHEIASVSGWSVSSLHYLYYLTHCTSAAAM